MLRSPEDLLPDDAPRDLRRFVAYWIAKADGRRMPAFSDIDAVEIPWALSRVYVVRVVEGGSEFVYRLAGEAINQRHGGALTGKSLADLFAPPSADAIRARWCRVAATPAAYYADSEHPTTGGSRIRGRRVVLPLGPAGGPVDYLIGMTVFEALNVGGGAPISGMEELEMRWVDLRDPA